MRRGARAALVAVLLAQVAAPALPARAASLRRVAGPDRYATAAAVALDRWTSPSDVFLASGADPADALAGAYGSGLHGSPILLTTRDELPAATLDALRTIDPTRVRILGGTGSVSDAVAAALAAEGFTVVRHAGADRFATAAAVARSGGSAAVGSWRGDGPTAVVVNGHRPFDALAAGPLAAGQLFPILLTTTDALPAVTMATLDDLAIRHVIVSGGSAAVSDAVVAELEASGRTVRRVAGADRSATAVALAGLLEELGHDLTRISLTSAASPADAVGAGPWGAPATPVLLCATRSSCGQATVGFARSHDLAEVVVVGGSAAVSDAAAAEIAA